MTLGYSLFIVVVSFAAVFGAVCQSPKVTPTTFSTRDAFFHMSTTFIAEFTVECSNGQQELSLYADVNGRLMPVAVAAESSKYQVTWAEEHANAPSGNYEVKIYDEDSFAALRKAQRNKEDESKVPTFAKITLNHPGASRGMFIATETIALVGAVGIFYVANSLRSQLQH